MFSNRCGLNKGMVYFSKFAHKRKTACSRAHENYIIVLYMISLKLNTLELTRP
jgi:hypothetical protein